MFLYSKFAVMSQEYRHFGIQNMNKKDKQFAAVNFLMR